MKKNLTIKLLSLAAILVLMLSMLSLTATAAEPVEYMEWEMNESGTAIYNSDGKTFYSYESNFTAHFKIFPLKIHKYANTVYVPDDAFGGAGARLRDNWDVYSYEQDGEIILISSGQGNLLYTTNKGTDMIYNFRGGVDEYYYILDGDKMGAIHTMFYTFTTEMSQYADKHVGLSRLDECIIGEMVGMNKSKSLMYEYGCVYYYMDEYYYLDYSELESSMFDSNGDLNYGSVTTKVPLHKITGDALKYLNEARDRMSTVTPQTTYEGGIPLDLGFDLGEYLDYPASAFWITFAIVGAAIPLIVAVVGLVLANSSYRRFPRYWMAMSVSAVAWMFISLMIMIILLI